LLHSLPSPSCAGRRNNYGGSIVDRLAEKAVAIDTTAAEVLVGIGSAPHVLDLSRQILKYPAALTAKGADGYFDSLANIMHSPYAPGIFYGEHNRLLEIQEIAAHIPLAYLTGDFSRFADVVEHLSMDCADTASWAVDEKFCDRPIAQQIALVNQWVHELGPELEKLAPRPHHWILRMDPDGRYDRVCYDPIYMQPTDYTKLVAAMLFVRSPSVIPAAKEVSSVEFPLRSTHRRHHHGIRCVRFSDLMKVGCASFFRHGVWLWRFMVVFGRLMAWGRLWLSMKQ
jgi:hypothetical protein